MDDLRIGFKNYIFILKVFKSFDYLNLANQNLLIQNTL